MKYGFVKVAAAIPLVKVADCQFNAQQTSKLIVEADSKGVQVIIFPELNLTGYSCGDLFGQTLLLEQAEIALMQVMNETRQFGYHIYCGHACCCQFYLDELCCGLPAWKNIGNCS
mgnify:CR=1 FL=1